MTSVRWLAPAILWSAILSVPLLAETPSPGKPINPEQLVHLDESDPFYVGRNFPKLTTPQWAGQPARRISDALLRFHEQRQPTLFRGALQSHQRRRPVPHH